MRVSICKMPQWFRGAPVVGMITQGSYHSGNIFRVGVGLPEICARQGPGQLRVQGEARQGGRQTFWQSIRPVRPMYWEMEMPACAHTTSLSPMYSTAEPALVSEVSPVWGLCSSHSVTTGREPPGIPPCELYPLLGFTMDPHRRGLWQVLWEKKNLFNFDPAFPQQSLPYIF